MAEKGIITRVNGSRVKLKVPAVTGNLETDWSVPIAPGYGTPIVGEQVWVFYDHEDTTKPLYLPKAKTVRPLSLIGEVITITHVNFASTTPTAVGLELQWDSIQDRRYEVEYHVNFTYTNTVADPLWGRTQAFDFLDVGWTLVGLAGTYVATFGSNASVGWKGSDSYLETSTQVKSIRIKMNAPTGQAATMTFLSGNLRVWDLGGVE